MPSKSKLIDLCEQQILAHSSHNGALPSRLLSPIIETSAEILSTPLPADKTFSTTSQKTPKLLLSDDTSTTGESTYFLLQRFHQSTGNLHRTHQHLSSVNRYLQELTTIVDRLSQDETFADIVDPIATRLIQLRVKAGEVVRLLNQPSIKQLAQPVRRSLDKSIKSFSAVLSDLASASQIATRRRSKRTVHTHSAQYESKIHVDRPSEK